MLVYQDRVSLCSSGCVPPTIQQVSQFLKDILLYLEPYNKSTLALSYAGGKASVQLARKLEDSWTDSWTDSSTTTYNTCPTFTTDPTVLFSCEFPHRKWKHSFHQGFSVHISPPKGLPGYTQGKGSLWVLGQTYIIVRTSSTPYLTCSDCT